ncbi:MAG: hypothetical protein J6C01_02700 [Lachnospiraceae bacterium]|nr:hypothetical protein [Lachnospiraceae bacterium]
MLWGITLILSENEYRIILTWGEEPRDLDSHLTYYVNDEKVMHVYYAHKTGKYEDETIAKLNLDDVTSYGPETVTITLNTDTLEGGVFKYSVHNYTGRGKKNSTDLSNSGAMIRVYKGNNLIDTFAVSLDNEGNVWHVFNLDKEGVTFYNEFYDEASASAVE